MEVARGTENGHLVEWISIEPRARMSSQECQGQAATIGLARRECTQHAHTSEAAWVGRCFLKNL